MTIALHVEQELDHTKLGASQAAGALGCDPYTPPIAVYRKLRGLPVDDSRPDFVREAAEWGRALEPIVRGKYALDTNRCVVVPEESVILDDFRATPDGWVYLTGKLGQTLAADDCGRDDAPAGLLEVKTCSAYKREEWEDGVPQAYEIQVRVAMAVCDMPWCDVVCLVGGQQFRGPFRIDRDPALEDRIMTDLREFVRRARDGVEPSPDATEAWRRHVSEKMRPSQIVLEANEAEECLVAEWLAARGQRKDLEAREEKLKTDLLLRMSAAGATRLRTREGTIPAYKVGGRFDWKAYAQSLGGHDSMKIPERFYRPSTTWALKAPEDVRSGSIASRRSKIAAPKDE